MAMDRISESPQHILHHMLSLLSQKDAIRTCVLSKSWRYLGSTRPNLEFRESFFNENKEKFLSVVDNALQRYHDRNLSIQEFLLEMSKVDDESTLLLHKLITIVILHMGVNKFRLSFLSSQTSYFDMPSVIFKAEFLNDLHLQRCKLTQIDTVLFKHLRRLTLKRVYIADETFQKIISSCPLIKYVTLHCCDGLKTIKVTKADNLKHFNFHYLMLKKDHGLSFEIDAPAIKRIRIYGFSNWFHHNKYFNHLKSLYLCMVQLSSKSFDCFSSTKFPCLEKLDLKLCHGFDEFRLSSHSIKHLSIAARGRIKADIHVANILYFEFIGRFLPSISFTTNSSEWKSHVYLWRDMDFNHANALPWLVKLNELHKALSDSKIYLRIEKLSLVVPDNYSNFYQPVVIEKLSIGLDSASSVPDFLNGLFRIFHPRYVEQTLYADPRTDYEREANDIVVFLCEILMEKEKTCYFWQQYMEGVKMEASDKDGVEWHPVHGTDLSERALLNNQFDQKIRFRLKWRELGYLA